MPEARLFSSFWMAGFESACHITRRGVRLDMIQATQHDRFLDEDYANLAHFGIGSVRDTVRWHLIESRPGVFDFASMDLMIEAAAGESLVERERLRRNLVHVVVLVGRQPTAEVHAGRQSRIVASNSSAARRRGPGSSASAASMAAAKSAGASAILASPRSP